MLQARVEDMAAITDEVSRRLTEAGGLFRSETGEMRQATQTALTLLEQVGQTFHNQAEQVTTASVQAGMQIADNREALKRQADALTGAAEAASRSLQLISDAFAQQAEGVEERTELTAERVRALIEMLRTQSGDIAAAGDLANQQLALVGRTLSEQVSSLERAAGASKGQLKDLVDTLSQRTQQMMKAVDESEVRSSRAAEKFQGQIERLTEASKQAEEQSEQLKLQEEEQRRDLFLKTARYIVEELNSITIDLTRVLQGEVPEADWRRYVKGDRTVFTRTLLRTRQASIVKTVMDKIRHDPDARKYVLRYIDQFDRLLEESEITDPEHLLHSTFLTSDVGKLYILLCRATGREE